MFDLRIFSIRESGHRIHNPLTEAQLAAFGGALDLPTGARLLDLGCGSGELLSTWARDHHVTGLGVDANPDFIAHARARADELGVTDSVRFVEADATGYVADDAVDVAACVGATWIGGGLAGTLDLLRKSLKPGGMLLIGEPYWRAVPTTAEALAGCGVRSVEDYLTLPDLLASLGGLGWDVVEMVCATEESWDRYQAPQWLAMRRWADAHRGHELHDEVRRLLATEPQQYAAYTRTHFGWGLFALIARQPTSAPADGGQGPSGLAGVEAASDRARS
ncbi:methyltransferase domain-containing protein [Actinotalea sp. M2MS4P-6]|uniref:SAM-dependent methyltransferase n=1 Tax=Actinotalea sp. M2MS4P-6 TaxID=2983762 RepID=UPI0021E38837|nr:class I SAM-dependent methyltransferase [Actinotalea sp. M2MS4P-6]MCV2395113.1 methyltransferase domain-containing protein [Actinotalea sp. M2MS4P-6]